MMRAAKYCVFGFICVLLLASRLSAAGVVTGYVTDEEGQGISEVTITLSSNHMPETAITDADGHYRIEDLEAGEYSISTRTAQNYVEQSQSGIAVTDGQETVIDLTLRPGATISGSVRTVNGAILAGVTVNVYESLNYYTTVSNSATTGGDGTFTLNKLAAGTYSLCAFLAGENYIPHEQADIAIAEGQITLLDEIRLVLGSKITGRLVNSSGEPLEGLRVSVMCEYYSPNYTSQADGTFELAGLDEGLYRVSITADSTYYLDKQINAPVTGGETCVLGDVVLEQGAVIRGTVTGSNGDPEDGADVTIFQYRYGSFMSAASSGNATTTDAQGAFTITRLGPGEYYLVAKPAEGSSDSFGLHGGTQEICAAQTITVASGEVAEGKDIQLHAGYTLEGTLTDSAGNPLGGVDIYAGACQDTFSLDPEDFNISDVMCGNYAASQVRSNPDGTFCLGQMADGFRYRVFVNSIFGISVGGSTAYGGSVVSHDMVGNGNLGDIVLQPSGAISGRITDEDGNPLSGIMVFADCEDGIDTLILSASDDAGYYVLEGLNAGNYIVGVNQGTFGADSGTYYVGKFYPDTAVRDQASPIAVAAGETHADIDFSLQRGVRLSGTVTDPDGYPVQAFPYLKLLDNDGNLVETRCSLRARGYTFTVPSGSYRVMVYNDASLSMQMQNYSTMAYAPGFYDGAPGFSQAQPIEVVGDEGEIEGIDLQFLPGHCISGTVVDQDGEPIVRAKIEVKDELGIVYCTAYTSCGGIYTTPCVADGDYWVSAGDNIDGVVFDPRAVTMAGADLDHIDFPTSTGSDSDGDGVPDSQDAFPHDVAASVDSDGDGYPDSWNAGMGQGDSTTGLVLDAFPSDAGEWADADGDGVGDNTDAFDDDPNEWSDSDGDGVGDNGDAFPQDVDFWLPDAENAAIVSVDAEIGDQDLVFYVSVDHWDIETVSVGLVKYSKGVNVAYGPPLGTEGVPYLVDGIGGFTLYMSVSEDDYCGVYVIILHTEGGKLDSTSIWEASIAVENVDLEEVELSDAVSFGELDADEVEQLVSNDEIRDALTNLIEEENTRLELRPDQDGEPEVVAITTNPLEVGDSGAAGMEFRLKTSADSEAAVADFDAPVAEIEVKIEAGTQFWDNAEAFTGSISPPRQLPLNEALRERLKEEDDIGDNPVVFSMGSDDTSISFGDGQTVFVKLDLAVGFDEGIPSIYYYNRLDDEIDLAGVEGFVPADELEFAGTAIASGGTVLALVDNGDATLTYTVGVVLDHMSTYLALTKEAQIIEPESTPKAVPYLPSSDDDRCFVETASLPESFSSAWLLVAWGLAFVLVLRRRGIGKT